jgi:hypothetical protein
VRSRLYMGAAGEEGGMTQGEYAVKHKLLRDALEARKAEVRREGGYTFNDEKICKLRQQLWELTFSAIGECREPAQ